MSANDFTELFSLHSLELIGDCIRPFAANPAVDEYADKMSLAWMYAGFSLGIASIGQDHVITHPMGEEPFHMPHGDACAMALPAVIEWNGLGCKEKYRKAYNALAKQNVSEGDFQVKMLIDWVIQLNRDLHLASDKSFEAWGYNKDKTKNPDCNYPRVTRMKEFAHIIERIDYYSKVTTGEIPYEFC